MSEKSLAGASLRSWEVIFYELRRREDGNGSSDDCNVYRKCSDDKKSEN